MVRFVSGQYANVVRHGGMLGYVLDGDITAAIANVQANIENHHVIFGMEPPGLLRASSIMTGLPSARESGHLQSFWANPVSYPSFVCRC
jgi:hypothetical protein